ncbi:MAG: tetratricopeptide repeat protein [Muribaculaceae bacterium]|nr:tetratricopeptide repeat protein [Muribaculaceae bacterium]
MKCILPLLLVVLTAVRGAAQMPVDSIYDENPYFILMGEADRAIAAQDWAEAVARLNDAIAVDPANPSNALVYCNMGLCQSCLGNDSLALESYDRSLEIAPRMSVALMGRGRSLLSLKRDREAFEAFGDVIEIDSLSQEARFFHGMMALYGGNATIAENDFNVLRSVAPDEDDTYIALSTLYSLTGREREAIPYLSLLVESHPDAEYYSALAGCYLALGQLTEASATIHDGLERFPTDPELYYYRAWLYRDMYRSDDAKRDARKAVELGASPVRVNALFEK